MKRALRIAVPLVLLALLAVVPQLSLDIPVIVGDIVPEVDVAKMHALGVATILGPGTSAEDLVTAVRGAIDAA